MTESAPANPSVPEPQAPDWVDVDELRTVANDIASESTLSDWGSRTSSLMDDSERLLRAAADRIVNLERIVAAVPPEEKKTQ